MTSLPEIYLVLSCLDLVSFVVVDVSEVEALVDVDIGVVVVIIDANWADIVDSKAAVSDRCIALHSFM